MIKKKEKENSNTISAAKGALQSLMDETHRKFKVPCVFCTNGFGLPEVKAKTLSERLGVYVSSSFIL